MVNSWKNSLGRQFNLLEIIEIIQKFPNAQIHVGTDSHFKTGHLIFATVIAIHEPGYCSRYFFKRTKNLSTKVKTPLRARLLKEVQDSIDIANRVREIIGEQRIISVHADISENKKNKSSVVSEQAKNWIYAMGFDCKMKPISWASSSIADLHAK